MDVVPRRRYNRLAVRRDIVRRSGYGLARLAWRNRKKILQNMPYRQGWNRKMGLTWRPAAEAPPAKRRKTVIGDPASYKQLASVKRKYGRKVAAKTRAAKLWRTVTTPYRCRFGTVQDINAGQGTYWLTRHNVDANTQSLPVYAIGLTNIYNGSGVAQAAYKMFELRNYNPVGNDSWYWHHTAGTDPNVGTGTSAVTDKLVVPTETSTESVGRKGLLDWVRIRLCIWGKRKNPSNIRIRLVRFTNDELCPNYDLDRSFGYTRTLAMPSHGAEYWSSVAKYVLNGHMSGTARIKRPAGIKVLKEWDVNINPVDAAAETTESDIRTHMKHLDLFHRFNRIVDYTDRNDQQVQTLAQTLDVNLVPSIAEGFTGYPADDRKGLWLIIESVQPGSPDAAASTTLPRPAPIDGTDFAASFDVLVDTNFTKVEKNH